MRALTIQQPWAWAVAAGYKRIENRTWSPVPGAFRLGERIAIHAGKTLDQSFPWRDLEHAHKGPLPAGVTVPGTGELVFGAIIATAKVTRFVAVPDKLSPTDRAWFQGPWGWMLEDVRRVAPPVEVRGALSLWYLGANATELVLGRQEELLPAEPGLRKVGS